MLNKSFKPWSLALVLLLATSYLEVAALPTVKENPERVALEQRAAAGDQDAQVELNYAASSGGLGFNDLTGRTYLEQRAAAGDKFAQRHLNDAARSGKLGLGGLAYLEQQKARVHQ